MILAKVAPPTKTKPHQPNLCTLEHLYGRGHPLRGTPGATVAACFKCNREKGWEWSASLSPD